jgi:hypothetical protein
MSEAVRLTIRFFEDIKQFKKDTHGKIIANNDYKRIVRESIEKVLIGGLSPSDIDSLMDGYKSTHKTPEKAYDINDILSFMKVNATQGIIKDDPENLLLRGKFYYHPQLQITPPPPMIELLSDGTFRSSYELDPCFYLEIKHKYTLDNLVDYFYNRVGINKQIRKRDRGGFEYLLKFYELDVILYSIDEASVMYIDTNSNPPRTPLDIEEYMGNGEALLEDRKNTLQTEGLDHVIPRPR